MAETKEMNGEGEANSTFANLLNIGHQEMDRIVDEIEQIFLSSGQEWLPLEPIGMMMTHEM